MTYMWKHIIHDALVLPYPRISFIIKKNHLNICNDFVFYKNDGSCHNYGKLQ